MHVPHYVTLSFNTTLRHCFRSEKTEKCKSSPLKSRTVKYIFLDEMKTIKMGMDSFGLLKLDLFVLKKFTFLNPKQIHWSSCQLSQDYLQMVQRPKIFFSLCLTGFRLCKLDTMVPTKISKMISSTSLWST